MLRTFTDQVGSGHLVNDPPGRIGSLTGQKYTPGSISIMMLLHNLHTGYSCSCKLQIRRPNRV